MNKLQLIKIALLTGLLVEEVRNAKKINFLNRFQWVDLLLDNKLITSQLPQKKQNNQRIDQK